MKPYGVFAKYYDTLMADVDYAARADYLLTVLSRHGLAGRSLLDLGCGTGAMSFEFAKSGFDVVGVDSSAQMLARAASKAAGSKNPIFICQDMRSLDLYGTVAAAVCALDGINHLTGAQAVEKAFAGVSLFLEKGGLFVFDLNTPYKLENTLGDNAFVYDCGDVYCVWQNSYGGKSRLCRFDLTFFELDGGTYRRYDESFCERAYSTAQIKRRLAAAGLALEAVYDDLTFDEPKKDSERLIYVARKI